MQERIKKIIEVAVVIAVLFFVSCCLIKPPLKLGDIGSYISYAVTLTIFIFIVYERFLWRFIPWNRPPVLQRTYNGQIHYIYKRKLGNKPIKIEVKQTWLTIEIKTKTDINASYTVVGNIVSEYGSDVLYYTYITNPDALEQKKNPIQYGTCRMILNKANKQITGKYWTTSQTMGEIYWEASSDNE